ncbi:hypothetical protein ACVMB0_000054 [Bradyrhizobium sp. USDA 4451]
MPLVERLGLRARATYQIVTLSAHVLCSAVFASEGRLIVMTTANLLPFHLGLTPQSVNVIGGFKVQDRKAHDALRLLDKTFRLQEDGCVLATSVCAGAQVNSCYLISNDLSGTLARTAVRGSRINAHLSCASILSSSAYNPTVKGIRFMCAKIKTPLSWSASIHDSNARLATGALPLNGRGPDPSDIVPHNSFDQSRLPR